MEPVHPHPEIEAMHPGENSLMFDVPASVPKWRELMERHGIETIEALNMDTGKTRWEAHSESIPVTFSTGETEREAVVALIHNLKLEGWETVSAR